MKITEFVKGKPKGGRMTRRESKEENMTYDDVDRRKQVPTRRKVTSKK